MKKINWLRESPFIILFALPWILLAAMSGSLPAKVPSHYSITANGWVADNYMSPVAFVAVLSIAMGLIYVTMSLARTNVVYFFKLALVLFFDAIIVCTLALPQVLKSNGDMILLLSIVNGFTYYLFKTAQHKPLSPKYFNIIWVGTHFIITLPLLLVLFSAQEWVIRRIIPEAVFLFLAVLGNLTKNVKPNFFIGIRTPWTLMDEEVWRRTHREMAKWLFAGGLTGFIVSIFAPLSWLPPMLTIFSCSYAAYSIGYSYFIYKQQNPHLP
jgi:uncharacterized membrane protein